MSFFARYMSFRVLIRAAFYNEEGVSSICCTWNRRSLIIVSTGGLIFGQGCENWHKLGTKKVLEGRESLFEKRATGPASLDSQRAAFTAANLAESKKAFGTVVLDVRQVTVLADYFVITGGDTAVQVRAIVDAIDKGLSELGHRARSIEGKADARWVLLDYSDVIIHVLQERERSFYRLEQFWNQALVVDRKLWVEESQ
jgi:ribosome-associated protein